MKKTTAILAAALLLAPFSSSALAQSAEQANCDLIRNAAEVGRARAIDRLGNLESMVKQQLVNARSCMERFGDLASRQTVNVGGFDVGPIRDAIFQNACSVIQGRVNQATSEVNSQLANATHQITGNRAYQITTQVASGNIAPVTQQVRDAVGGSQRSIWDRLGKMLGGDSNIHGVP